MWAGPVYAGWGIISVFNTRGSPVEVLSSWPHQTSVKHVKVLSLKCGVHWP